MKYIKRVTSLLLALVLSLAMTGTALAAVDDTGFADVDADAWFADAAVYCRDNGLMSGTAADTFSPNRTMTRAMLAVVLYRIAGSPTVSDSSPFTDVANGSWCADAVIWTNRNGIVSGYGNGLFGANHAVTREQIAAILWRYAGSPAADAGEDFADKSSIAAYVAGAVDWARANGIVGGKAGNLFDPKGNATRAQVAAILMRYHSRNQQPTPDPVPSESGKVLIAYFSCTGNTETVAGLISNAVDATLYEITPEQPYTAADLNYNNSSSRSQVEQRDPNARPAISGSVENMEGYDVVFLGYPIWNGDAPRIISTFLESYDFSGKTIVPFCTSASSGIGSSAADLQNLASGAEWLSGQRFSGSASQSSVDNWMAGLNLVNAA